MLAELAKGDTELAARIVTTSPDVTVSTNLGGFVNRRGLFSRHVREDVFKQRKIASPQIWAHSETGQHIELGIAEHNLFLMLGALGLSADLFGQRLFPVGTVYDPFIARGLDALNYACYQDARFILAATPSGVTLAPEGGAHQSISTPLIGMGQPGLLYMEPAYADEVSLFLHHAFERIQASDGGSTYLRLSTRPLPQPERSGDGWEADALKGAYWRNRPGADCPLVLAYAGALAPEAEAAFEQLTGDLEGVGLLAITSPDRLHSDWMATERGLWTAAERRTSHIARLLSDTPPGCPIVTVIDGSPSALSWLGSVRGNRLVPLGTEQFGQTGDLPDTYALHRLDVAAILDAAASALSN